MVPSSAMEPRRATPPAFAIATNATSRDGPPAMLREFRILALLSLASALQAQRPAIMNGYRHEGTEKLIPSLDWAGLYTPLPQYDDWWRETAKCAGKKLQPAQIASVQFYYVNSVDFAPAQGPVRIVVGATYAQFKQIYVAVRHITRDVTVKHEMLHQILYWSGVPNWNDDSRSEFERCGLTLGPSSVLQRAPARGPVTSASVSADGSV